MFVQVSMASYSLGFRTAALFIFLVMCAVKLFLYYFRIHGCFKDSKWLNKACESWRAQTVFQFFNSSCFCKETWLLIYLDSSFLFSCFLVTCLSFIQSLCIISSHTYVQLRSTAQDCWSLNFFDLLLLLSTFSFRIHVCCMDYEMHFTMVDVSLWSQLYSASDVRFQSQCRMFLELFSSLKFCYTSCNLVFVVFRVCLCFMHST